MRTLNGKKGFFLHEKLGLSEEQVTIVSTIVVETHRNCSDSSNFIEIVYNLGKLALNTKAEMFYLGALAVGFCNGETLTETQFKEKVKNV